MVRFGIVGTGKIVCDFLGAAKRVTGFQLQAVYSRTMEKATAMAKTYGASDTFDSLEAMAACADIDAVYIASPNSCHCNQVKQMLEHGKHVICEKPVVTNLREWEMLLEVARQHHVVLIEAMRPAFNPGFTRIEELLPRLGRIRRATFQYSQYSSRYDAFKAGSVMNAFNPELSNGAIMDIGVYCIHGIAHLFGMPKTVTAHSIFLENGMEAMGTVVASYEGMLAEVLYSKVTDSAQPSEIQGENGSMLIQSIQDPCKLMLNFRDGSSEVITLGEGEPDLCHEIRAFIEMVCKRQQPEPYQAITTIQMQILDQVRKQAGIHFPADDGRNCGG